VPADAWLTPQEMGRRRRVWLKAKGGRAAKCDCCISDCSGMPWLQGTGLMTHSAAGPEMLLPSLLPQHNA
jgi:hypothetical protein